MLSPDLFKNHTAILGMTGSGKTSAAKAEVVEPALERGERVCIIDPTGVWWGLRSSVSGKRGAYDVVIFGGDHADMPLLPAHARILAEAVATSNTPTVFDTKRMTVEDRSKFFTEFAKTLMLKNRGSINLIIDEAHLFAPKGGAKAGGQTPAMLNAANSLVSGGRSLGLRVTVLSQRPAKLHNDCLTQCQTLIAMQLIYPHDRQAVKDWIADQAYGDKAEKDLMASLPQLKVGQGWVWSPRLGVLEKISFPRPRTYDSSKAPGDDDAEDAPVLASINLDVLKTKLTAVETERKANDPKELKDRIAQLERDLKQAQAAKPMLPPIIDRKHMRIALENVERLKAAGNAMAEFVENLRHETTVAPTIKADRIRHPDMRTKRLTPTAIGNGDNELSSGQQKVLDALAWWSAIGHEPVERKRACVVAGFSVKASTFGVYVAELINAGFVIKVDAGKIALTQSGWQHVNHPEVSGRDDLYKMASSVLGPKEQAVFAKVYEAYPESISRKRLSQLTGLSETASTLGVYLATIIGQGIIEKRPGSEVIAAEWLFP